jgi:hypothetical protein
MNLHNFSGKHRSPSDQLFSQRNTNFCKMWALHGSDWRMARSGIYINKVRTSQETHYLSATESSQLMLCKIWGLSWRWLWRMSRSGIYKPSSYQTGDTLRLRYKAQLDNSIKIWGSHGSDYEEFHLLWYKPSSYLTGDIYVSATGSSQLMLCKIWGFHGGGYEECRLLGYKTQFIPHRKHIMSPLQSPAS